MNVVALHESAWQRLAERRTQLPHALLIVGPKGIGKFDLACAFAESLLCEQITARAEACGHCAACGWLAQGNHPDLRLLQPTGRLEAEIRSEGEADEAGKRKTSQQITIDQVRALDEFLHVGTHRHGLRIVLLNPAEAMNRATANALLKSLEEPIPGTLFLLVSGEPHRLLPTIRSRCQSLMVRQPSQTLAVEWLRRNGIADAEVWLALAGGSPLSAHALNDSGERALLDTLLAQVSRAQRFDPLVAAAELDKRIKADVRPAPLKRVLDWAQKWLFDLTLARVALPPRYFLRQEALLQSLATVANGRRLLEFNRKAIQYKAQCEQPVNSRLFLEDFFLGYSKIFQTL